MPKYKAGLLSCDSFFFGMYQLLKNFVKNILPQKFLFENEVSFRSVLYPLYKGTQHQCNICGKKLKTFVLVENGNHICPICGSLPRTRRLWKILNENYLKPEIKILDFSPSRAIFRNMKSNKSINYFSTDFENEFLADYRFDITNIDSESDNFNLIICYHILEHIENDQQAMDELFRVLKNNGTCLIQTPFKEGETYEDFSIKTKEDRLKHFGQDDHVRIYSVDGLKKRLENSGFSVEVKIFSKDDYFGFSENETILFCTKN